MGAELKFCKDDIASVARVLLCIADTSALIRTFQRENSEVCGRFGLFTDLAELVDLLSIEFAMPSDLYVPRWNIAPTSQVLVVTDEEGSKTASFVRWGLIPSWAKADTAFKRPVFNARSETVAERPMFRGPFANRRCLVPADGFYEWARTGSRTKTPMWFYDADERVITFAGISSIWRGPDGVIESCAILTAEANSLMSPTYNRMPVVLSDDWSEIWLDPAADRDVLLEAMRPREWENMRVREAHPDVGSARNDGPHLVERQTDLFG